MFCVYCGKELEEGVTLCPFCGGDNSEETKSQEIIGDAVLEDSLPEMPAKKSRKGLVIGLCVAAVLALAAAAWYFINDGWLPRENDIFYKESYTVSDEKAKAQADRVIATIGDKTLTNSQLQMYYWMQVYDYIDYYGAYAPYMGLDYTKPLDTLEYSADGGTWQQHFLNVALETWHRYQALNLLADEAGYELSDDYRTMLENMPEQLEKIAASGDYASVDEMLSVEMGAACTLEGYLSYLELFYRGIEYFEIEYDKLNPTDAEVEEYFNSHLGDFEEVGVTKETGPMASVRHILIQPEGGSMDQTGFVTYTEEAWADCLAKAEDVLNQWKTGEATEESFIELVGLYSFDGGSSASGGLYTDVWSGGNYVEPFTTWSIDPSRQTGDTGIVKTDYGYHIMYFVGSEPVWLGFGRTSLKTELANQMIENAMEENPMEVDYRKIILGFVDLSQ